MVTGLRSKRTNETRRLVLRATRALLGRNGADMTLDDVAKKVGVAKQTVLYHFPSKERLMGELAMENAVAEAMAMEAAVETARGLETLRRFAQANLAWHCADFERLRLSYLRPQIMPGARDAFSEAERQERLYPSTTSMYDSIEERVRLDASISPGVDVRKLVVAVHLATIGFATVCGMLNAVGTAFRLPIDEYLDELLHSVIKGAGLR